MRGIAGLQAIGLSDLDHLEPVSREVGRQWVRAMAAWQDAHAADRSAEEAPAR